MKCRYKSLAVMSLQQLRQKLFIARIAKACDAFIIYFEQRIGLTIRPVMMKRLLVNVRAFDVH